MFVQCKPPVGERLKAIFVFLPMLLLYLGSTPEPWRDLNLLSQHQSLKTHLGENTGIKGAGPGAHRACFSKGAEPTLSRGSLPPPKECQLLLCKCRMCCWSPGRCPETATFVISSTSMNLGLQLTQQDLAWPDSEARQRALHPAKGICGWDMLLAPRTLLILSLI